jgi:hypothetical protein
MVEQHRHLDYVAACSDSLLVVSVEDVEEERNPASLQNVFDDLFILLANLSDAAANKKCLRHG